MKYFTTDVLLDDDQWSLGISYPWAVVQWELEDRLNENGVIVSFIQRIYLDFASSVMSQALVHSFSIRDFDVLREGKGPIGIWGAIIDGHATIEGGLNYQLMKRNRIIFIVKLRWIAKQVADHAAPAKVKRTLISVTA